LFYIIYVLCVNGQTEISVLCVILFVILCVICPGQCHRNCILPKSTMLISRHVTSRLNITRHLRPVERVDEHVERVEPCCSNMANDEQSVVLACKV